MHICRPTWSVKLPFRQAFRYAVALFVPFLAWPFLLPAQENQAPDPLPPSGLAAENLGRVAASATQVEDLLRKEPGLLVELKRWVAKEATDRGQILDDAELTDQAIFERLTLELEFRARATRLLQRYGYLMPELNPDSEEAKERELLLKERTRRLARTTAEEDNSPEEKDTEKEFKRAEDCGAARGQQCVEPRRKQQREEPEFRPQERALEMSPSNLGERTVPRQSRGNPIEEPGIPSRQLIQTVSDPESGAAPSSAQRRYEPSPLAASANMSPLLSQPASEAWMIPAWLAPVIHPLREHLSRISRIENASPGHGPQGAKKKKKSWDARNYFRKQIPTRTSLLFTICTYRPPPASQCLNALAWTFSAMAHWIPALFPWTSLSGPITW